MTRFRALLFGQPLAPWQATRELAEQAAIEAGEAAREPDGRIYLSAGVEIEIDAGEPPALTPELERWAEALQVIKMMGDGAEEFVAERMRALADDPAGRARWEIIGRRIALVREAAARGRD
jgi:hypothetical protein